ncbi:MAG: hypothetical protein Q4G13_08030 [Moraxella sp.]|nr:hypothetical protein [Moraxella sp.]
MTVLVATHEPFLQSPAQLFILPMSSSGTVLHPVLARTKTMFVSNYSAYRQACREGIELGDVLLHRVQKQQLGLGVASNQGAQYIANLISCHHAHHDTQTSTIKACLSKLAPELFELVRYQGVRRAALLASPMFGATAISQNIASQDGTAITVQELWSALAALDMPRLRLDVHLDKAVCIDEINKLHDGCDVLP